MEKNFENEILDTELQSRIQAIYKEIYDYAKTLEICGEGLVYLFNLKLLSSKVIIDIDNDVFYVKFVKYLIQLKNPSRMTNMTNAFLDIKDYFDLNKDYDILLEYIDKLSTKYGYGKYLKIIKKVLPLFNFKNENLYQLIVTIYEKIYINEKYDELLGMIANYLKECSKYFNSETIIIFTEIIDACINDKDDCLDNLYSVLEYEKSFNLEVGYIDNLDDFILKRREYMNTHELVIKKVYINVNKQNINTFHVDSEFLNTYAENLTEKDYITNPAIARESEISSLELVLVSPKKSPLLLGEAGVGKTAVVEGLAYNIQKNNVPNLLKEKKIFKITATNLIKGCKYVGDTQERFDNLIKELKSHQDVIVFMDEIHTIVGAGAGENSNIDISNMLKPFIDRGEVKVIGATTLSEYQKYIQGDKALVRRFFNIEVDEPSIKDTACILFNTIPQIEAKTLVKNKFDKEYMYKIIDYLIKISALENQDSRYMLRRPELPLTILEMAFSYGALDSRGELIIDDIINSIIITPSLNKEKRMVLAKNIINEIK